MSSLNVLRDQYLEARGFLEETLKDVTQDQAQWLPAAKAIPIGAQYAHIVISEDMTVNGLLRGAAPLFAGEWAGKTGASGPPPLPPNPWDVWARETPVDLAALRRYAEAVHAATDTYLASLEDGDLDRLVDLSAFGQGEKSAAWLFFTGCITNVNLHCGEISCLKGLQGAKGYPA